MNLRFFYFILFFLFAPQLAKTQSKYSIIAGGYYNGLGIKECAEGYGLILGCDYKYNKFISVELKTRYGLYSFGKDNWELTEYNEWALYENDNTPSIDYFLFCPTIGVAPKFHFCLGGFLDDISLFIENEFSVGLMTGNFGYAGQPSAKKSFTEPIFVYNIALGVDITSEDILPGRVSFGYSTLNFTNKIRKHQPLNYQGDIPEQSLGFVINVILIIPLKKNK